MRRAHTKRRITQFFGIVLGQLRAAARAGGTSWLQRVLENSDVYKKVGNGYLRGGRNGGNCDRREVFEGVDSKVSQQTK
jgi:hypothetical protein